MKETQPYRTSSWIRNKNFTSKKEMRIIIYILKCVAQSAFIKTQFDAHGRMHVITSVEVNRDQNSALDLLGVWYGSVRLSYFRSSPVFHQDSQHLLTRRC